MRRRQALIACALIFATEGVAEARPRPDRPKVTVRTAPGRRAVVARTARPGAVRVVRASGCTTWMEGAVKMRRCPSLFDGRPFEVADDLPAGTEEGVVTPPSPTLFTHGRWYTQRLGYVWVDPSYGADVAAPILDGSRVVGTATVRLRDAMFDPGYENSSTRCRADEVLAPYDSAREHHDQRTCWFIYLVSGTYRAKLRLYWEVRALRFTSGAAATADELAALGEIESDSTAMVVTVQEIQSLVPCKSTREQGCDVHG